MNCKASQSLPPAGGKKLGSFFTATCAWGKIPLRLPVWNFGVYAEIMRAAACKTFWQKIPQEFSPGQLNRFMALSMPWVITAGMAWDARSRASSRIFCSSPMGMPMTQSTTS